MERILLYVIILTTFGCNSTKEINSLGQDNDEDTLRSPSTKIASIHNSQWIEKLNNFEESEVQEEHFINEIIELDSLLGFDNYLDSIKSFKPEKLNISIRNEIIQLDFAQMYCKTYNILKQENEIPNVEKLRNDNRLRVYCRDIASDLDIFPKRTGSLKDDAQLYLEVIENLLTENQDVLEGMNFQGYLELERNRNLTNISEKFLFRKKFLKFLYDEYFLYIK